MWCDLSWATRGNIWNVGYKDSELRRCAARSREGVRAHRGNFLGTLGKPSEHDLDFEMAPTSPENLWAPKTPKPNPQPKRHQTPRDSP